MMAHHLKLLANATHDISTLKRESAAINAAIMQLVTAIEELRTHIDELHAENARLKEEAA